MKVRESQSFLSLFSEPLVVETACGGTDPHTDAAVWKCETKSLGQVPTPRPIAQLMARWVVSLKPATVLDPAAGLGSLLHECHRLHRHAKFVGVERDQPTLLRAKSAAPYGTKLILADYLLAEAGQFQGIIANPPYVKAHRLAYSEGTWQTFEESFGTPLDRLTNLYCLFLLKIWKDLALHGRAAVITPAEFLNANFGTEIKDRLCNVMRPPGMIVFNPTLNLFGQTLTTSAIIFLERGRPKSASAKIVKVDSLEEAETFLQAIINEAPNGHNTTRHDLDAFEPGGKWLNILLNGDVANRSRYLPNVVGDFFNCRRGIATGGNDFFCLSKSELARNKLDLSDAEPCITRASDASGLLFTSENFSALASSDRKCYLLNPRHSGSSLENYLKIGERLGIPRRHLPSHRPIWYLPENRAVADIWVAVFSRESPKFILNASRARNLTCFHGLYVKSQQNHFIALLTLFLNSTWGRFAFAQVNRFYGDGLNKLEPKDVEALPCPHLPDLSADEVEKLTGQLKTLETLRLDERHEQLDVLVSSYFGLPKCPDGVPFSD
ncbi:MAG: class I SAM-dependent DNA methyltransferase [Limisphaerales bacterium]